MIQNQKEKTNRSGSRELNTPQKDMEEIIEEMTAFICDDLCRFRDRVNQEDLEKRCSNCDLSGYIEKIKQEYDLVNDFEKSQLGIMMRKYKNITLCEECSNRIPDTDGQGNDCSWCKNLDALDGDIGKYDGCSRGKRKL